VADETKLLTDFSQYVKDNVGDPAALLAAAAELDADQVDVQATVDEINATVAANPVPPPASQTV
jgi:hypothetical protein